MRTLILGGTGLISTGIVKHLLARGSEVAVFNRGQRPSTIGPKPVHLPGDRNDPASLASAAAQHFDTVIDMIGFTPEQADLAIGAFGGRCQHFIFCSTVCTYGVKIPAGVVVDESFPQEPISGYGKNKLLCEQKILGAAREGKFAATVIRPSCTYGPGNSLIDQLESNPVSWDRIARGLPVLMADGGMGLWNSTHRDDVGKLFAHSALNPVTYGRSYNATTQRVFTWRDIYRETAAALGTTAWVISVPADWIIDQDPKRFGLLAEITRFHGAYTSAAAMGDVPEFRCEVAYIDGAKETLDDLRRRQAWRSDDGGLYQKMVDSALALGFKPQPA